MANVPTGSTQYASVTRLVTVPSTTRKMALNFHTTTPDFQSLWTDRDTTSGIPTPAGFNASTTSRTVENATYHSNQSILYNITDEEKHEYLSYLQDQTTMVMIPAMIFLIILATIGLIGNSLVLFVYSRKFKQTSTRIFIMAIASFDIVTNVVAIPGEIYDMFHIWDFDKPIICKTRLFINAFTTMVAAMVLVAVAAVRYRKICKPFQTQVSVKLAKTLSVVLAALSLLFSVPYAIINGRQTKGTPRNDVFGFECTVDDEYVNTKWPLMNGAFFIFLFIACCIPLVVMYILIGVTAWKHSRTFGTVTFTKGKKKSKSDNTGISNEASTKTTDESDLKFTKTPKTRSFVKNKGDSTTGVATSSQKEGDNTTQCYNNRIKDNRERSYSDNAPENTCEDEGENSVDNLYDVSTSGASRKTKSNNCDIRTVRSPTGQTVHINLLMVKELTMKLKAVKKDAENLTDKNDDNCSEPWKADYEDKSLISSIQTSDENSDKTQNIDTYTVDKSQAENSAKEDSKRFVKKKIQRNKSANNSLCDAGVGKIAKSPHCRRVSKSLGDLTRLTVVQSLEKDKKKAAESEDLDLRPDACLDSAGVIDQPQPLENEEPEASKDEPMSEFVKAMQWIDLTYCLQDDQKDNENGKNDANGDEPDTGTLSKKGSFAIGRKISRDNSFLQRHKKLKDALTDTLTRARRNRKDREVSDAEGKGHNGNCALENINSESDNVCNDDEPDNAVDERRTSEPRVLYEARAQQRKSSGVKEELISDESCHTVVVAKHVTRRRGVGRTTGMLILISAVYILGFLPFLGLMFAKAASPNTFRFMDIPEGAVFNFFLRSYFLNSAANPVIYSLCDINFRRECLALLKRS